MNRESYELERNNVISSCSIARPSPPKVSQSVRCAHFTPLMSEANIVFSDGVSRAPLVLLELTLPLQASLAVGERWGACVVGTVCSLS